MDTTDIAVAAPAADHILEQLRALPREEQLAQVLALLSKADEAAERIEGLISEVWDYAVNNRLWEAGDMTLEEVKVRVNWEALYDRIRRHGRTRRRLNTSLAGIRQQWGGPLEDAIPGSLLPSQLGVNLLENLHRLSKATSVETARPLLVEAIQWRLHQPGKHKANELQTADVLRALSRVKAVEGSSAGSGDVAEVPGDDDDDGHDDGDESAQQLRREEASRREAAGSAREMTVVTGGHCSCPGFLRGRFPGPGVRLPDEEGLALVREARKGAGLPGLCQRHLRLLAAGGLGLLNNKTQEVLCWRLKQVYLHRTRLPQLRQKKPKWFRAGSRAVTTQDLLGTFRFPPVQRPAFDFDPAPVLERFGGAGSWEAWQRDGTINVPGLFAYLGQEDVKGMIDQEFLVYRHHHRTPEGKPRLGWLRNMYYSLIQQLVRQDPAYYALTAAARPDRGWRLISYPYITKNTGKKGEATGFLHMDLNLEAYLRDGSGGNRLTSSVSIDDEDELGCTVAVKGFHHHIQAWHGRLLQRGWGGGGLTTNCSQIYTAEDRAQWGEPVPVPCPAWGVRLSLPQLIHGSSKASVRRRRTILPWYMLVDGEHKELEAKGCLGWSEVRQCHLDLEVPRLDPSGYPHKMGAPTGRFGGAVVLGSTSALGDALVGRRKWTDPQVQRERDLVLGRDGVAALAYVKQVRGQLVEQYRAGFEWMKQTELEGFGEVSYFAKRAAREAAGLDPDDEEEEVDSSSGSSSLELGEGDLEDGEEDEVEGEEEDEEEGEEGEDEEDGEEDEEEDGEEDEEDDDE